MPYQGCECIPYKLSTKHSERPTDPTIVSLSCCLMSFTIPLHRHTDSRNGWIIHEHPSPRSFVGSKSPMPALKFSQNVQVHMTFGVVERVFGRHLRNVLPAVAVGTGNVLQVERFRVSKLVSEDCGYRPFEIEICQTTLNLPQICVLRNVLI